MELKEVLRFADDKVFSKTGKHLDDLQEAILKETLQGRKYAAKVAQDRDCSDGYVRVAASELWKILSDVFGEDVSKGNVRAILERAKFYNSPSAIGRDHVTNNVNICQERARSPTKPQNPQQTPKQLHIDLGDAPQIFTFFDRTSELSTLENWITGDRTRLIALLGISGIGKTTLSLRLIDQIKTQFDYVIYRSLRFSPTLDATLTNLLQIFS
ncbi:ATPase, partial [Microcoleus anatoxicus PTRS1]